MVKSFIAFTPLGCHQGIVSVAAKIREPHPPTRRTTNLTATIACTHSTVFLRLLWLEGSSVIRRFSPSRRCRLSILRSLRRPPPTHPGIARACVPGGPRRSAAEAATSLAGPRPPASRGFPALWRISLLLRLLWRLLPGVAQSAPSAFLTASLLALVPPGSPGVDLPRNLARGSAGLLVASVLGSLGYVALNPGLPAIFLLTAGGFCR